jgi:hypothetical protein
MHGQVILINICAKGKSGDLVFAFNTLSPVERERARVRGYLNNVIFLLFLDEKTHIVWFMKRQHIIC